MYFLQYHLSIILIYSIISILLSIVIIFCSILISIKNLYNQKLSAYECGFDPYGDSRTSFNIHFYIVGLIFLIFDLETIFLIPWSVGVSFMTQTSYWYMVDFIVELLIGFWYVWVVGVLDWK